MRDLWRRHDAPHRHLERWACLSLLHLLELCDQGQIRLQGGRSIPMDKLDTLVTDHLIERLFKPERLTEILVSLSFGAPGVGKPQWPTDRLATGNDCYHEKLKRLYRLVEDGLTDLDEVLKDRLNTLKADRDRVQAAWNAPKSFRRFRSISILR